MNTIVRIGSTDGVSEAVMQRIAQRNRLESHATGAQEQDMAGLAVALLDLRADDPHGSRGLLRFIPRMESLAAACGATIQHPGDGTKQPGEWSNESFFVYPSGGVTPHKGGRTVKKSLDVTPETDAILKELRKRGVSLGDLVEQAAREKLAA